MWIPKDEVTTQESVNRRQSDTTVGPQSLHDMCPGVEHLTNPNDKRNKRNVFLQVNVSACDNLPENPYHQGVIYGLCNTSTSFCKMYIRVNFRKRVRAHV
ncbi:hypothetical protein ACOMHN_025690 [Nucella lapillus]